MAAKLSPLASVSETRAVLEAHGLTTKYSLGQNFLVNDAILQKIVALAQVEPRDFVLEVGPGIGTLTIALLKHAGRVVSVERDADLPAVLAETLAPWSDRFALIQKDALDLTSEDLKRASAQLGGGSQEGSAPPTKRVPQRSEDCLNDWAVPTLPAGGPTKLVSNLPYAVAATVVLDYFQRFASLESATVMVQKEVADRMAASPGSKNYGAYTVKLRLYAEPAGRFAVGPGNFFPPPRVESAVLRLNRRTLRDDAGEPLSPAALEATCLMADAAFASRRKTLSNSCKTYFAGRGAADAPAPAELPLVFERAGIDPARRGETLDLEEFIRLGKAYQDAR